MNIKELDLIEKQDIRERVIGRTEVLDKVGDLLLLPNTEYATTDQVAKYYGVGISAITSLVHDNRDEVGSDGYKVVTGNQLTSLKEVSQIKSRARQIAVFPKRAILRVGMLLRDSEVAKEVRTRLLDIIHDTEKQSPEIIDNVIDEMTKEQQIYFEIGKAMDDGNMIAFAEANTKLNNLKNKRINELKTENEQIKTHALTITESRAIINRLVRNIAMKEYNSMFGKAYGDLYTKVNYILGINIKARNKKKSESYLNTLTEEETFEVEKIVRTWAVETGLDLEKLLKIA